MTKHSSGLRHSAVIIHAAHSLCFFTCVSTKLANVNDISASCIILYPLLSQYPRWYFFNELHCEKVFCIFYFHYLIKCLKNYFFHSLNQCKSKILNFLSLDCSVENCKIASISVPNYLATLTVVMLAYCHLYRLPGNNLQCQVVNLQCLISSF